MRAMNNRINRPFISIIVAVYNGYSTLQQCIDSVATQSFKNIELIVIDGGSTDGTVDLLSANTTQLTYWISEPDDGIYSAWNKALRHATGEWVCFLGADDYLWSDKALAEMAEVLKTLPEETIIAYGQVMLLGRDDASLYTVGAPNLHKPEASPEVLGLPPHPGLMHRLSVFADRGGFDESFHIAGDTELLFRELRRAPAKFVKDVVVVGMRQGGISSNPANVLVSLRELRRIQRKYDIRWPGLSLTLAWARAWVRFVLWSIVGERFSRQLLDFGRKMLGKPSHWTKT